MALPKFPRLLPIGDKPEQFVGGGQFAYRRCIAICARRNAVSCSLMGGRGAAAPGRRDLSWGHQVSAEIAVGLRSDAAATSTVRAYAADLAAFENWCAHRGHPALPTTPAVVAAYLTDSKGYALSTLRRRIAAIARASVASGAPLETKHCEIRAALREIGAVSGEPARRAVALTIEDLRRLVAGCRNDLCGLRDRALLVVAYAGALHRGELVAIDCEHLVAMAGGLKLSVIDSYAKRRGQSPEILLARTRIAEVCPVRAIEAWLAASGIQHGPVFRKVGRGGVLGRRRLSADAVRQILLRRAAEVGIKGSLDQAIRPGSLRSGFVTSAYRRGIPEGQIMAHARYTSMETTRRHRRQAKIERPSPTLGVRSPGQV